MWSPPVSSFLLLFLCARSRQSSASGHAELAAGFPELFLPATLPSSPRRRRRCSSSVEAGSLPIQFRRNRRLHWSLPARQGYHILVFDTVTEVFRWKRPPLVRDQSMRLLEFPGYLGLSVFGLNKAALELWRLDDYKNEVWARMYRIQLLLLQMPVLQEEGIWIPGAVSMDGDVLIEAPHWVLHCDRNGNLLRQFRFPQRLFIVRHFLKESLLPRRMFREQKIEGATEPRFFHGLCSDPSF